MLNLDIVCDVNRHPLKLAFVPQLTTFPSVALIEYLRHQSTSSRQWYLLLCITVAEIDQWSHGAVLYSSRLTSTQFSSDQGEHACLSGPASFNVQHPCKTGELLTFNYMLTLEVSICVCVPQRHGAHRDSNHFLSHVSRGIRQPSKLESGGCYWRDSIRVMHTSVPVHCLYVFGLVYYRTPISCGLKHIYSSLGPRCMCVNVGIHTCTCSGVACVCMEN